MGIIVEMYIFILGLSNNLFYFIKEIVFSNIFTKNKLNILFSVHDRWEKRIKFGFAFTRHKVTFGSLDYEKINNYDLVVPFEIPELSYLRNNQKYISNNMIPIPSMESVELCNDKYLLNKSLIDNGFELVIPKMGSKLNIPYILKKKIDAWGINSHMILNDEIEDKYSNLLQHSDYFLQEAIPGKKEYATHIIVKNKEIINVLNIEHIFRIEFPIKGKDKRIVTRITPCPHIELFRAILIKIEFEGLCCINYKELDEKPYLIEINPRFGGSLAPFFFSFIRNLDHPEGRLGSTSSNK
jgi:predicted ATP-grasp superfamily ATP-dependent carboligase